MESFKITYCAVDGELLASSTLHVATLSKKWLAYCDDLLVGGPIVSAKLDGPLATWTVECTAGKCSFSIGGHLLYVCAILRDGAESQNKELLSSLVSPVWQSVLAQVSDERPLFLVVDLFPEGVEESSREAMFQFAYHFAAAYLKWFQVDPTAPSASNVLRTHPQP